MKINSVRFLVPIQVSYTKDDNEKTVRGELDYVNHAINFFGEVPEDFESFVFDFLDNVKTLYPNSFEAKEEVYEQASRAQSEYQNAHKQHVGD